MTTLRRVNTNKDISDPEGHLQGDWREVELEVSTSG